MVNYAFINTLLKIFIFKQTCITPFLNISLFFFLLSACRCAVMEPEFLCKAQLFLSS